MKKNVLIIVAFACAFALALAGCSSSGQSSNSSQQSNEEPKSGVANPWSDVKTAEEAALGAGVDVFAVPEGAEIDLGKVEFSTYRCMDGIAEAVDEFPAVKMTIRKALNSAAVETAKDANGNEFADISGDYGEYKNTWSQNIKGLEVTCFGNRKGEATKTIWSVGDYCWSIVVLGLGGDDDYGLSADDLSSLINAMQ